jgi:uncharacterized coiled-coil protein SlyX
MTDHIPLDDMTSDQLDQLYADLAHAQAEAARYAEAESADVAAGSYAGRVEELQADLTRYEEVLAELNETLIARAKQLARAEAAIARVHALHHPVGVVAAAEAGNPPDCAVCGLWTYPCATIRALDGQEQP